MNALIIDDEAPARDALSELLKTYCPSIKILGTAENGAAGLELINTMHPRPDIVFMDVEMPMMSGFEVLEKLIKIDFDLIFVTAHDRHAVRAFEFSAVDFLLKPVDFRRLIQSVEKASEQIHRQQTVKQYQLLLELVNQQNNPVSADHRIAFAMHNEIVFSWVRNLIWIEADTNMCWIKLSDHEKRLYIAKNIGEYERLFAPYSDLKRVHRSYIANRNHVKKYLREDGELLMSDGKSIPISGSKKDDTMDWIGLE